MSKFKLPSKFQKESTTTMVPDTSIEGRLNAKLPKMQSLVKTLAGHELSTKIVHPFAWAAGLSDREMIATAVNTMVTHIQGRPFYTGYSVADDEATVLDHEGQSYLVNIQEFECLIKIMFCSWLNIGIIDASNADEYYEFKSDRRIWKVLD